MNKVSKPVRVHREFDELVKLLQKSIDDRNPPSYADTTRSIARYLEGTRKHEEMIRKAKQKRIEREAGWFW